MYTGDFKRTIHSSLNAGFTCTAGALVLVLPSPLCRRPLVSSPFSDSTTSSLGTRGCAQARLDTDAHSTKHELNHRRMERQTPVDIPLGVNLCLLVVGEEPADECKRCH
jgi:hypothetical protein